MHHSRKVNRGPEREHLHMLGRKKLLGPYKLLGLTLLLLRLFTEECAHEHTHLLGVYIG